MPARRADGTVTGPDAVASGQADAPPPGPLCVRYRPALLRLRQDWVLDHDRLTGPRGAFDLRDVTGAVLAEIGGRHGLIRRLDLLHPGGKLSLPVVGAAGDRDVGAHADLTAAVLARLALRDPDLPLTLGEGRAVRITMFVTGVVAVLFAATLGIAAAAGAGRATAEVFLGMGALGLFGLVLSLRHAPWRRPPRLTVGTASGVVVALKG